MQEEIVAFKFDVSNKRIKRKAMKAVWKYSGVTLVDIKEKGKLKVRGTFSKIEMGLKLKKIDKSVDIIDSMGNVEQNYNHGNVPKMQEIIFRVINVRKANTVIWEFSGVTSVEVKGFNQLVVKGEFDNLEMVKKLKKKDKYVTVVKVEENVEAPPQVGNQFDAGSSNGPKAPERSHSTPVAQPQIKQQGQGGLLGLIGWNKQQPPVKPPQNRGWNNPQPQNNQQGQGGILANLGLDNLKAQIKKQGQVGGVFGFLGGNKQQPKFEHRREVWHGIDKEKAEKLRIEKEQAEKQRIEKEKAEKQRIEKEKAEIRRIEEAKAEKRRIEKAKEAEKRRIERERAEKRRIERERAEKLRIERERADELRRRNANSTSRTGGQGTQTQTQGSWGNSSWLTGLSTTASQYSSRLTGAIGSTVSNSTMNPFSTQTTRASGSTLPTSTVNPFSSQSTRVTGTTNPFASQSTRTSRSTRY